MRSIVVMSCSLMFAMNGACTAQQLSHAYAGAGIGESGFISFCNTDPSAFECERRHASWKVFGGYRFSRYVALELGYVDFGKASARDNGKGPPANGTIKAKAWEIDALGMLPLRDSISIYGKLGGYRATTTAVVSGDIPCFGGNATASHSNFSWTRAIGITTELSSRFAFRGELQRYSGVGGAATGTTHIDVWDFGLVYSF